MFIENYLNNRDKSNSKKSYSIIVFYIICAFVLCITQLNTVFAGTGINQQIPYSGSLVNNAGVALSDGSAYRAKFVLWNALSGGTQVYEEIRDGITVYPVTGVSPALSINDGRFDILLGSQNATLPTILNNDTLFLEIQLDMDNNGSYEEVFNPRRRIGAAVSAINALRLVVPPGGSDTDTLSLDIAGNVIATSLGGVANGAAPLGYDRVLLANSSGQFSQVNISTLGGAGSGWGLLGNAIASSANTIGVAGTGSFLGSTTTQSLQLVTNSLVRVVITSAGDLLTSGNVIIGNGDTNAAPAAANLRGTNASGTNIAGNTFTVTGGRGTGTGVGGDLLFATAPAGLTGASLNAAVTRLQITAAGNILVPILGGSTNPNFGSNDRVLLANSSGQFSQVASSFFSLAGSDWLLAGNATASAWNGTTGNYLGTTSTQPLVLATTNATAQDIRLFTGVNGANERLRIGSAGAIIIGNGDTNTTPAAANLRGTDASGTNIAGNTFTVTGGRGTGTGVGGDLLFATAPAGLTGASLNAAVTRLQITAAGNILAPILGGTANATLGSNDRVLLADSSGQFSQAAVSVFQPGGSNNQLQYKNGTAFAGASNVEIAQGALRLIPQTTPTNPTSGSILYTETLAGRDLPFYLSQTGRKKALGQAWYGNQVPLEIGVSSGTNAPISQGGTLTTAATISSQQTVGSANRYTSMFRKRYATATANTTTGIRQADAQFYSGSAAGYGGVFFSARFGVATNKLASVFVGLSNSTAALGGNASALVNMIGMGYDVTDLTTTNWFLMKNNGAGTAQRIDLGATNAARAANIGFELNMYNPPNSTTWFVFITNINTGAVVLNTSYVADAEVPVVDTGLSLKAEVRNDAVATQCDIEHNYIYVEPQGW